MTAALDYLRRGWAPLVYARGSKAPKEKGWPDRTYTEAELEAACAKPHNVGIILGERSGGLVDIDLDTGEAVTLAGSFLPATEAIFGRKSKPRSHWLYVARPCPKTTAFKDSDGATLLEIRADGHQTMLPPSEHPSGELVTWDRDGDPAAVGAEALVTAVGKLASASLLVRHWPAPGSRSRQDAALALAGGLLRGGWDADRAGWFIGQVATAAGDDEAGKRASAAEYTATRVKGDKTVQGWPSLARIVGDEVVSRVREWLGLRSDLGDAEAHYLHTDGGNSEAFADDHRGQVRYCHAWSKWLVDDGQRWNQDATGEVERRAKATARRLLAEASQIAAEETRKKAVRWALTTDSRGRREAMVALAQSEPGIPVQPDQLDRDPWLLNVANGTIDLHTGTMHAHNPNDLITKLAPVEYNGATTCPRWTAFVEEVLPDPAVRSFVQKALGYSLTGVVSEQVLFFAHGSGANGKSVFLNVAQFILGDYALQAAPDMLMVTKGEAHPTGLADLHGRRFVATVEVEENQRLAESRVKWMTGGDTLRARRLYEDYWSFTPTFKLWLAANHRPVVKGQDLAIWRRIRLIPFTVTIPEEKRDPRLSEKLKAEASGILRWAVEGCLLWQREGLQAPAAVSAATESYRAEQDTVGRFLGDRCVVGTNLTVKAADLYRAFKSWCDGTGERPLNQTTFGLRLGDRGLRTEKRWNGWWRVGVALLTDDHDDHDGFSSISGNLPSEIFSRGNLPKTASNPSCPSWSEREPGSDDDLDEVV